MLLNIQENGIQKNKISYPDSDIYQKLEFKSDIDKMNQLRNQLFEINQANQHLILLITYKVLFKIDSKSKFKK